jgi:16S rRNA (guanine966-N2)-methyltransferase
MRIIAGQAKGLGLKVPADGSTRPMDGMSRGALFNILMPRLAGARVLDLYAGSGSLGLEALSRGAERCLFVERSREAARLLEENLERSRLSGGEVLCAPCAIALRTLAARAERFALVFFDPPFAASRGPSDRAVLLRELAAAAGLLEAGGLAVWRLERRNYCPEEVPAELEAFDRREYGRSLLVFARRRAGAGGAAAGPEAPGGPADAPGPAPGETP